MSAFRRVSLSLLVIRLKFLVESNWMLFSFAAEMDLANDFCRYPNLLFLAIDVRRKSVVLIFAIGRGIHVAEAGQHVLLHWMFTVVIDVVCVSNCVAPIVGGMILSSNVFVYHLRCNRSSVG